MKYSNREVAWRFARGKTDGDSHSGSLYIEENTIYSYGKHFPIARREKGVVLFTTDSATRTTAKHMSYVRQALHGEKVFHCFKCDPIHLYGPLKTACMEFLLKIGSARTNTELYLSHLREAVKEYEESRTIFTLSPRELKKEQKIAYYFFIRENWKDRHWPAYDKTIATLKELRDVNPDAEFLLRLIIKTRMLDGKTTDSADTGKGNSFPST